jgi:hypothetical protein
MPIDSVTSRLPNYQDAMRAQPRSTGTLPPPRYEFAPAYSEKPSSAPARSQVSSEPATNLRANRISNFHSTSQAVRGMNFRSGL